MERGIKFFAVKDDRSIALFKNIGGVLLDNDLAYLPRCTLEEVIVKMPFFSKVVSLLHSKLSVDCLKVI